VSTGEPVKPEPRRLKAWDEAGRRLALKQVGDAEGYTVGAAKFLGRLKVPEDRAVLERMLRAPDGGTSRTMGDETSVARYATFSDVRKAADDALAAWDGKPRAAYDRFVYLGVVDGTVRLPEVPKGTVWLYLVPEAVTAARWAEAAPPYALRMDVGSDLASPVFQPKLGEGNAVRFGFSGVIPGRYWVKAVYDAAAPFHDGAKKTPCVPAAGDFESDRGDVIEVAAGGVTDAKAVACDKPVAAKK
jgi:hypothetical protein